MYIVLKRRGQPPLETVIDLEEYENKISKMRITWTPQFRENTQSYYVQGHPYLGSSNDGYEYDNIYLHRVINETPYGMLTDHKDHDTLNNRKSNLSSVTYQENSLNRKGANLNNRLGQKNITFDKSNGKYLVQKTVNGKNTGFGTFETLDEAVKIRDMIEKMSDDEKLEFKRKNKKKSGRKKKAVS